MKSNLAYTLLHRSYVKSSTTLLFRSTRNRLILAAVSAIALLILLIQFNSDKQQTQQFHAAIQSKDSFRSIVLNGEHARFAGVDTYWQHPVTPHSTPHITLLFHGCSHSAADWFTLPEERRIIRVLLSRGHSVVAFSSADRQSACWDTNFNAGNWDVKRVIEAFNEWSEEQIESASARLFATGASSGGTFVSIMSRVLPLTAAIIQISPASRQALTATATQPAINTVTQFKHFNSDVLLSLSLNGLPRLGFVLMVNDREWASVEAVKEIKKELQGSGAIAAAVDSFRVWQCEEREISAAALVDFIDELQSEQGLRSVQLLIDALVSARFLHSLAHRLVADARSIPMQVTIDSLDDVDAKRVLSAVRLQLEEELNVSEAKHELTSEYIEEIMQWAER